MSDLTLCCSDLSERLNLSKAEGEKWIVNLIRETRMGADAKIDLEKVRPSLTLSSCSSNAPSQNVIEIHRPPLPIYQSVIEKTRGLAFRTQAMGAAMARPPQAGGQQGESNPVAVVVDGAR
jgi:translation initiation factor 3 subunit E